VLVMVLVPAVLMVSTIRFRSFKTIDLQSRRPYTVLIFIAAAIVLVATHPRFVLVAIAYTYLASAFIGLAITRFRHRGGVPIDAPRTSVEVEPPRGSATG
jgi:CDP-diacylglycerol--serine O-phosphatidyltransferase